MSKNQHKNQLTQTVFIHMTRIWWGFCCRWVHSEQDTRRFQHGFHTQSSRRLAGVVCWGAWCRKCREVEAASH